MTLLRRLLQLCALLVGALAFAAEPRLPAPEPGKLTVYFLEVSQGDAALIVSPTGKTILIDGGPPEAGRRLASRVASIVHEPLDLMVLSHPHLDHLGGLSKVIRSTGAKRYLDPGFDHPSSPYRDLLRLLGSKEIPSLEVAPAEDGTPFSLELGGDVKLTILWPRRPKEPFISGSRSDANANSLVLRIDHERTSFLFTGDAEADTEARLLRSGLPLRATVLKVAHHGSRHSSQAPFLARVAPKVAVISCGAGNEYRHPHGKTLHRLASAGAAVVRVDLEGTVRAESDGSTVTFSAISDDGEARRTLLRVDADAKVMAPVAGTTLTAPEPEPVSPQSAGTSAGSFVASRRSKVFHRSDCPTVSRIAAHNRIDFDDRAQALSERKPSGDCNP